MNALVSGLAAVILYISASILVGRQLANKAISRPLPVLALGGLAFPLQLLSLHQLIHTPLGFNFSLFNMLALISWLMAGLTILFCLYRPVISLTVLAFPAAALSSLLSLFVNVDYTPISNLPRGGEAHIVLSVLAYSLLTLAATMACLLAWQNRRLKEKRPLPLGRLLPPLQTMEYLLFETIAAGFVLLSLAITSGFFYVENLFAQHLVHKTVLSIASWIVFAALLAGRYFLGWRGPKAIRLTLIGFTLLVLGFFGSKAVLELILHRT